MTPERIAELRRILGIGGRLAMNNGDLSDIFTLAESAASLRTAHDRLIASAKAAVIAYGSDGEGAAIKYLGELIAEELYPVTKQAPIPKGAQ